MNVHENLSCKTTDEASFSQDIVHKADPDAALNVSWGF